jgi:lipoprotein NlpI
MNFLLATVFLSLHAAPEEASDLYQQAGEAWKKGDTAKAIDPAGKAIAQGHIVRGQMYAQTRRHAEAIKDFEECLRLDPKYAEALDQIGSEYFRLGKVERSLEHFDRYLQARPDQANGHWKRGISLYYVRRYDDGRKQFGAYENVDTNDVENAVWHMLCNAKANGLKTARKQILKIGKDKRVPMMEVYALFKGDVQPADVLAAANAGDAPAGLRKEQLFYAHLYLGLYYDMLDDKKKALEHISLAAGKYRSAGYMGDVAWVHEQYLKK